MVIRKNKILISSLECVRNNKPLNKSEQAGMEMKTVEVVQLKQLTENEA